jgi:hypothetical protein
MIDRGAQLPVKRQAELLDLSRSSVYYRPRPVSERDLGLMRRIRRAAPDGAVLRRAQARRAVAARRP